METKIKFRGIKISEQAYETIRVLAFKKRLTIKAVIDLLLKEYEK